jgi:hypothetical protein
MSRNVKGIWRSVRIKRVVGIGAVLMLAAFLLLLFLASLGDSDLPPYDPPFPGEQFGWLLVWLVAWPLVLVAGFIGHDPPFILWFPLIFLGGVCWALLIELLVLVCHRRKPINPPQQQNL